VEPQEPEAKQVPAAVQGRLVGVEMEMFRAVQVVQAFNQTLTEIIITTLAEAPAQPLVMWLETAGSEVVAVAVLAITAPLELEGGQPETRVGTELLLEHLGIRVEMVERIQEAAAAANPVHQRVSLAPAVLAL
jgi:hypothetical protein